MGEPMRTDPVDGSGLLFQVDPASLSGAAAQLGHAYDDMNTAIAYYASAGATAPAAFGDFGTADAWSSFDSAWSDEPAALELPEPLIGTAPTALARDWLTAARSAGTGLAVERLFAQWLDMVAALVALRRRETDRRRSATQAPATTPEGQHHG